MGRKEAERLLQRAYDGEEINLPVELEEAGVMSVHIIYYDSQLVAHPEIKVLLTDINHPFTRLITALRDARLAAGAYSPETLNEMYGLLDG